MNKINGELCWDKHFSYIVRFKQTRRLNWNQVRRLLWKLVFVNVPVKRRSKIWPRGSAYDYLDDLITYTTKYKYINNIISDLSNLLEKTKTFDIHKEYRNAPIAVLKLILFWKDIYDHTMLKRKVLYHMVPLMKGRRLLREYYLTKRISYRSMHDDYRETHLHIVYDYETKRCAVADKGEYDKDYEFIWCDHYGNIKIIHQNLEFDIHNQISYYVKDNEWWVYYKHIRFHDVFENPDDDQFSYLC